MERYSEMLKTPHSYCDYNFKILAIGGFKSQQIWPQVQRWYLEFLLPANEELEFFCVSTFWGCFLSGRWGKNTIWSNSGRRRLTCRWRGRLSWSLMQVNTDNSAVLDNTCFRITEKIIVSCFIPDATREPPMVQFFICAFSKQND